MATVKIIENGCRGCTLCKDICPVDVFDMDEDKNLAIVSHSEDCIGCLSCTYLCPSQCIDISDVEHIRPFHRIEKNVAFVEQFLQMPVASTHLTEEELLVAYREIGLLLTSFSSAIYEVLGRGHKSVGRRAGIVAATHLPEMYGQKNTDALMARIKERFGASFDFDYTVSNNTIKISVKPCGLLSPLRKVGLEPGNSDLCLLFHEYWAGLISAFTGKKYSYTVDEAGESCKLIFEAKL